MTRRPLFNPANMLTLFRFVAAPFMVGLLLTLTPPTGAERLAAEGGALLRDAASALGEVTGGAFTARVAVESGYTGWKVSWAILILISVTLLTDMFDGWAARKLNVVTDFGKIMDPVADSTFFMTVLFALSACPRFRDVFPVWLPLIVLYREVAMQVLRRYGALRGKVMAAKWSGKIKMAAQSVALTGFFLLLALSDHAAAAGAPWFAEATLGDILFWIGVGVAGINIVSMIEYLRDVPSLIAEWHEPPANA